MDTIQKTLIGITIGAVFTAASVMVVSFVKSGVWLSKAEQLKEINNLSAIADEFIVSSAVKHYSAKAMFIEHCEARLLTWTTLHGIRPDSELWLKYREQYLHILNSKFNRD